ncbi:peptidylprolyl isomerase [Planctomycetota bacterium]
MRLTQLMFAGVMVALVLLMADIGFGKSENNTLILDMQTLQDTCQLGDTISLKISLKNTGKETVEVNELDLDIQSLGLHINYQGKRFYYTRVHSSPFQLKVFEKKPLDPGGKMDYTLAFPAVGVGDYQVYAEYLGAAGSMVISSVRGFSVTPKDKLDNIVIRLQTTVGDILIDLKPEESLGTVINFVTLVQQGFYDGLLIYAVIKDTMIQAGDPHNNGGPGGPEYTIPFEKGMENQRKGTISMLRLPWHMDTAGSQFMILTSDEAGFGFQGFLVIFGQVIEGLDVLDKINVTPVTSPKDGPRSNMPKTEIKINKMMLEFK